MKLSEIKRIKEEYPAHWRGIVSNWAEIALAIEESEGFVVVNQYDRFKVEAVDKTVWDEEKISKMLEGLSIYDFLDYVEEVRGAKIEATEIDLVYRGKKLVGVKNSPMSEELLSNQELDNLFSAFVDEKLYENPEKYEHNYVFVYKKDIP